MAAAGSQLTIVLIAYRRGVGMDGLIDALRRHGSRVLPAATGHEAEALVQEHGSVDLVILALPPGSPEMTGEASAVVHRWGSRGPHVPLMLISDTPPPDEVLARVAWWLAWPPAPDTLLAAIRDTLGG
jgi:DNA-binding response OmpR family regulator